MILLVIIVLVAFFYHIPIATHSIATKVDRKLVEIPDKKFLANIFQERSVGRPGLVGSALSME